MQTTRTFEHITTARVLAGEAQATLRLLFGQVKPTCKQRRASLLAAARKFELAADKLRRVAGDA